MDTQGLIAEKLCDFGTRHAAELKPGKVRKEARISIALRVNAIFGRLVIQQHCAIAEIAAMIS